MPQKKQDLLEKVPGLDLLGGFWTNLCAVVELGVKLFFCGGISQKLVCILCRLKRYNLIHHEDWGEKGILRFSLAISVKYIFSEATEGFVETEDKLTPHKFYRVHTKRSSPNGSTYSGFLRWIGGFVCLWHFCSEVVAVLHGTTYTSVMFFDFLKPNPKCKSSHSVAGIANSKALLATM